MDDTPRPQGDDLLDETLEETFPASDPPANTVETGIGLVRADSAADDIVTDNREAGRFELVKDGEVAFLSYERKPDALVFVHTEVPPSLRGSHVGERLVKAGLDAARAEGLRIVAVCPFVRADLRSHPISEQSP
jgi:predicted GNAT family acetyltransferase